MCCLSPAYLLNYTSDLHTNFLYILPTAVVLSCSGGVAIRYVLPVLWMTSYLHIMGVCTAEVPVGTASQPGSAARLLGQWPRQQLGLRAVAESGHRAFHALFMIPDYRYSQRFYRAMLCIRGTSHGLVSVCLCMCLSVTSRYSTKTAKRRIT